MPGLGNDYKYFSLIIIFEFDFISYLNLKLNYHNFASVRRFLRHSCRDFVLVNIFEIFNLNFCPESEGLPSNFLENALMTKGKNLMS